MQLMWAPFVSIVSTDESAGGRREEIARNIPRESLRRNEHENQTRIWWAIAIPTTMATVSCWPVQQLRWQQHNDWWFPSEEYHKIYIYFSFIGLCRRWEERPKATYVFRENTELIIRNFQHLLKWLWFFDTASIKWIPLEPPNDHRNGEHN